MRNKKKNNKSSADQLLEVFMQSLIEGMDLLKLKELENFHYPISLEDPLFKDVASFAKNNDILNKNNYTGFENKAIAVLERIFTDDLKIQLITILKDIELAHADDDTIPLAASASRVFLEDKESNHARLPLAIARFGGDLLYALDTEIDDMSSRGRELLEKGNFSEAEKIFICLKNDQPGHWEGSENLADLYRRQGLQEKAAREMELALKRAHASWQEAPEYIDYEVIEELEQKADAIFSRPNEQTLRRFVDYTAGLLYFTGAATVEEIVRYFRSIIPLPEFFNAGALKETLGADTRLRSRDNMVYLPEIIDLDILLSERSRRSLAADFPYSLSYYKLLQEHRFAELYNDDEKDVDEELARLTNGLHNLASARKFMLADIADERNLNYLVSTIAHSAHRDRILELLSEIRNNSPRWELAGKIPATLYKKREAEGLKPEFDAYITTFPVSSQKPGRNDPCPCGSGKKYKKCCGK